jgi:hypothetical protein
MNRTKVFISYSHQDKAWLERLQVHLKPLEREGLLDRWDDTRIRAGAKWHEEIEKALSSAKVAVLLVSADFLASDFIAEKELPPLLEAAKAGGALILPIIISPSRFSKTTLAQFQATNSPDKPMIDLSRGEQEKIWLKVSEDIEDALTNPSKLSSAQTRTPPGRSTQVPPHFHQTSGSILTPSRTHARQRSFGTWVFRWLLLVFILAVLLFLFGYLRV